MIRFACPRCNAIMEQPFRMAGAKLPCLNCGQRLQVPEPPPGRTMLGTLVEKAPTPATSQPVPPPPPVSQPYVTAHPESKAVKPRDSHAEEFWPEPAWADDAERSPPRRGRRPADLEDEDDDLALQRTTASRYSRETAARASVSGLVCSLIGVALLLIAFFLWILSLPHQRDPFDGGGTGRLLMLMSFISLGSFVMGLIGTILSSRGLDASNNQNRSMAVAGLVCGIIALVVASVFLLFFFFCNIIFWSAPH